MEQILIWTILAISGVFLVMTILIIANKAWRETQAAMRARRRKELEPKILSWAHGDAKSVRDALAETPSSFDKSVLEQILLDHIQRVRGIERDRLGRAMEQLHLIDGYLAGLESRRWWRRAESAEKLGLAACKRAVQPLAQALDDEMPEVRLRAAKALGRLGGEASARKLVHALNEPTRWSTIRIADILIGMGHQSIDAVIESFPGLSHDGQLAVLDIVGQVRPVSASPWLLKRLESESSDIRARACHALGSIGDPNMAIELSAAINDREWPVRAMAAKALGRMRVAEAIPKLANALRDEEWWVRHNAALALRSIGPRGIEALENLVADGDAFAREQAILMLEESGRLDERAGELAQGGSTVRTAAKAFLERVVAAGTTERLRVLSREHPLAEVRHELLALLPEKSIS
jgi:HEAT repeat protein